MEHQWTQRHGAFFSALMVSLNQSAIRYFVLRNFEELPENNRGKDVDIVIEPGSYGRVKQLMLDSMKAHSLHYYTVTHFDRMRCWYIMDSEQRMGIHIDLMENEVYHGFEFFRFDDLYEHAVPCKNFYVLDEVWHAVMLLVQNLVAYKSLKPKYLRSIHEAFGTNSAALEQAIRDVWGARAGERMLQYLRAGDDTSLVAEASVWSQLAMQRIFLNRPFHTSKNVLRFLVGKLYQLLWCPRRTQRLIAVEAPDGTGKTTFIDALVERLCFYYVSGPERFCVHHFRPQLLPNLGAVGEKAGVMKQDKDFTNPHRAKPAGVLSSLLRLSYYWLDYVVGVPCLLRKEAQYGSYTIFDRYSYDFLIDPFRSRINLPLWLRWLFVRLTPQPALVFVLRSDAQTVYRRKQELTLEEVERQLGEFRKLERLGKRCVFIDAGQSPQAMAEQAARIIMETFMERVG